MAVPNINVSDRFPYFLEFSILNLRVPIFWNSKVSIYFWNWIWEHFTILPLELTGWGIMYPETAKVPRSICILWLQRHLSQQIIYVSSERGRPKQGVSTWPLNFSVGKLGKAGVTIQIWASHVSWPGPFWKKKCVTNMGSNMIQRTKVGANHVEFRACTTV